MNRTVIVAALLALAVIVPGMPASAAKVCKGFYRASWELATTKSSGRSAGRVRWSAEIRSRIGSEFSDFKIAKNKSAYCKSCKKARSGCESKKTGYNCTAQGTPCRRPK